MNNQGNISCWFCGALFDLSESECCTHTLPTPVCPYCLNCFCTAPESQRQSIRQHLEKSVSQTDLNKHVLFCQPIGSILIDSGVITAQNLEEALNRQKSCKRPLGEILIDMGLVSKDLMRVTLLNQQWIEQIDLEHIDIDPRLIERFGFEFCCRHLILPLELILVKDHAVLRVAISRRQNLEAIRAHPAFQTFGILPYFAPPARIQSLLDCMGSKRP